MIPKTAKDVTFREVWLPNLVLPIGNAQPSFVLLAVMASFFVAFGLTCWLVNPIPRSTAQPPTSVNFVTIPDLA